MRAHPPGDPGTVRGDAHGVVAQSCVESQLIHEPPSRCRGGNCCGPIVAPVARLCRRSRQDAGQGTGRGNSGTGPAGRTVLASQRGHHGLARVLDEGQADQAWNAGQDHRGFSVAISRDPPCRRGKVRAAGSRHLARSVLSDAMREARNPNRTLRARPTAMPTQSPPALSRRFGARQIIVRAPVRGSALESFVARVAIHTELTRNPRDRLRSGGHDVHA
jgi:hypothetical protein